MRFDDTKEEEEEEVYGYNAASGEGLLHHKKIYIYNVFTDSLCNTSI